MKDINIKGKGRVEQRRALLTPLRRSDVTLQFRAQMVAKGIKNVDLAERIGVSEANISRWLKGDQNLSLDTMYQIADAIDEELSIVLGSPNQVSAKNESDCSWSCDAWTALESKPGSASVIDLREYAELKETKAARAFKPARSEALVWRNG
jgi:transcriptional regulator with XRE-family HTH domain